MRVQHAPQGPCLSRPTPCSHVASANASASSATRTSRSYCPICTITGTLARARDARRVPNVPDEHASTGAPVAVSRRTVDTALCRRSRARACTRTSPVHRLVAVGRTLARAAAPFGHFDARSCRAGRVPPRPTRTLRRWHRCRTRRAAQTTSRTFMHSMRYFGPLCGTTFHFAHFAEPRGGRGVAEAQFSAFS